MKETQSIQPGTFSAFRKAALFGTGVLFVGSAVYDSPVGPAEGSKGMLDLKQQCEATIVADVTYFHDKEGAVDKYDPGTKDRLGEKAKNVRLDYEVGDELLAVDMTDHEGIAETSILADCVEDADFIEGRVIATAPGGERVGKKFLVNNGDTLDLAIFIPIGRNRVRHEDELKGKGKLDPTPTRTPVRVKTPTPTPTPTIIHKGNVPTPPAETATPTNTPVPPTPTFTPRPTETPVPTMTPAVKGESSANGTNGWGWGVGGAALGGSIVAGALTLINQLRRRP